MISKLFFSSFFYLDHTSCFGQGYTWPYWCDIDIVGHKLVGHIYYGGIHIGYSCIHSRPKKLWKEWLEDPPPPVEKLCSKKHVSKNPKLKKTEKKSNPGVPPTPLEIVKSKAYWIERKPWSWAERKPLLGLTKLGQEKT